jgi:hypothetical protein
MRKKDEMVVTIDKTTFEKAATMYSTGLEIASLMNCSVPTLRKWCKMTYGMTTEDTLSYFRGKGNIKLRNILWTHAKRSPATAIFLAKNYLGMADEPVAVDTGERQSELVSAMNKATKTISKLPDANLYENIPDATFEENSEETE